MKIFHLVILLISIAVLLVSVVVGVDKAGVYLFGWKWPMHCFLYHTFGVKCAFCGLSRAFAEMGKGHIKTAFELHRLGPAMFVFVAAQVPYHLWAFLRRPKRLPKSARDAMIILCGIMAAAIFLNWLVYLGERFL